MAKNDQAWVRKIKDLTECSICTEEFVDPRALPCLHTFCFKCLRALVHKTASEEAYLCPLCRCEFDIPGRGVVDFPKNFYVDSLIDVDNEGDSVQKVPYSSACCDICVGLTSRTPSRCIASWYCSDCDQNLCDSCFHCHKRITSTNKHHLVPSSIASRGSSATIKTVERKFCERHPERVTELWCRDCREPTCTMCLLSDHNGHTFGAFRDSVPRSSLPRPRDLAAPSSAHQSWSDLVQASRRSAATVVATAVTTDSSQVLTMAAQRDTVRLRAAQAAIAAQAVVTSAAQAAVRPPSTQAAARPASMQAAVRPASTQTAVRPAAPQAVVRPAAAQTAVRSAAAQATVTQASELPELLRLITLRLAGVIEAHSAMTTTSVVTSTVITSTTAATSAVNSSTRTTSALVAGPIAATSTVHSSARTSTASISSAIVVISTVNSSTRPSAASATSSIASTVTSSASVGTPIVAPTTRPLIDSHGASGLAASASASAAELAPPFTFTGHCYRCGWQGHRAFECQEDADEDSASPSEERSGIASPEAHSLSHDDSSDDEITLSSVARALASIVRNQPDLLSARQVEILGDSDSSSEASSLALAASIPLPTTMHCNGCGGEGHTSRFCRNKQQCHNCGCYGHKRETCSRESRVTKCYECNEMGHVAQDCPTTADRRVRS